MRAVLALALAGLLLAPLTQAAPGAAWTGDVTATSVETATGTSPNALLAWFQWRTATAVPSLNAWTLTGESLTVDVVHVQANVSAGVNVADAPYETHHRHGPFTAQATAGRAGGRVVAGPQTATALPVDADLAFGPLKLVPSSVDRYEFQGALGLHHQHNTARNLGQTLEASFAAGQWTLRIHGDFVFAPWELDVVVREGGATTTYPSGHEFTEAAPGAPTPVPVGKSHAREPYFYVTDGTLSLAGPAAGEAVAYFGSLDVVSTASTHLEGVHGRIAAPGHERALDGSDVDFAKGAHLRDAQNTDRKIAVSVEGREGSPLIDGTLVPEAAPGAAGGPFASLTGASPVVLPVWLLLVVAGAAAGLLWWRTPTWALAGAMAMGAYGFVAQRATRSTQRTPTPRRAMMASVALLAQGRFEGARAFLASLPDSRRPEQPTWEYLMATASAGVGDRAAAAQHLQRCLRAAPQYASEVRGNAVLATALRNPPAAPSDHSSTYVGFA